MIEKMISEIKNQYTCKTQDTGVFKKVVIDGAVFRINAYNMSGLGRVSTVEMKRLIGLWEMQSLIITPFEKDMPIYYYNRHREKGKYIYRVELFDTQLNKVDMTMLADVIEKYSDLSDVVQSDRWYDAIKLSGCAVKTVDKKAKEDLLSLTWEHFLKYMQMLQSAKACKVVEKKKKCKAFVDKLCKNSGIAIIEIFLGNYGDKVTEKLANEVLFGLR